MFQTMNHEVRLITLGQEYLEKGFYEKALYKFLLAKIVPEFADSQVLADLKCKIGRCMRLTGRLELANRYLDEAYDLANPNQNRLLLATICLELGATSLTLGILAVDGKLKDAETSEQQTNEYFEDAENYFKESLEYFQEMVVADDLSLEETIVYLPVRALVENYRGLLEHKRRHRVTGWIIMQDANERLSLLGNNVFEVEGIINLIKALPLRLRLQFVPRALKLTRAKGPVPGARKQVLKAIWGR